MTTIPVLALLDFTQLFIVETDASSGITTYLVVIVQTNQSSLKFLLEQRVVNESYQKWVAKLFGYDFEIQFHLGLENKAVDALSHIPIFTEACWLIKCLSSVFFDHGLLLYKGCLVLPKVSPLFQHFFKRAMLVWNYLSSVLIQELFLTWDHDDFVSASKSEFTVDNLNHSSFPMAARILVVLLCKHEFDSRYQKHEDKLYIAQLYFPLIGQVLNIVMVLFPIYWNLSLSLSLSLSLFLSPSPTV
ncbi:Guanine nucleotide exchange factor SPIKE 1 [Vitis vinifera]|uniref:Guanine nucleotide exchange factor SPIKE 1 n=1 Tax=Vitis vinifera TaxID=29760 RepID=A0A438CZR1_VITVI|nr:Guanine nucleotide exchange factor SPIKE 1 [Vitis vinifera]